ncbi:hypothetical protein HMPREF0576_1308 [Mobiluncus holmesii ATCC 35242]|uniref:Uncharacterized protein n=2 Tax=Mobiluncus TaxID=2050 RepID=D6ZKQ7_MOBCV|nr:hypothetical protein HMPREF0573_10987 [Mobiluncus curtisii ATCC 43063]EFU81466.1 hypothetical protein HMPREF0576_1308 [Mobiluncus holmesii ATCC 35242]
MAILRTYFRQKAILTTLCAGVVVLVLSGWKVVCSARVCWWDKSVA